MPLFEMFAVGVTALIYQLPLVMAWVAWLSLWRGR